MPRRSSVENTLRNRLGHANINITRGIYGHVLPGMQEDAALRIDAALREAKDALPSNQGQARASVGDVGNTTASARQQQKAR